MYKNGVQYKKEKDKLTDRSTWSTNQRAADIECCPADKVVEVIHNQQVAYEGKKSDAASKLHVAASHHCICSGSIEARPTDRFRQKGHYNFK